jgi:hypothetical protein
VIRQQAAPALSRPVFPRLDIIVLSSILFFRVFRWFSLLLPSSVRGNGKTCSHLVGTSY